MNYSIKSKEHLNWLHEHHIELDLSWTKVAIDDHFKNKRALNIFAIEKKTLGLILGHFLYEDQKSQAWPGTKGLQQVNINNKCI